MKSPRDSLIPALCAVLLLPGLMMSGPAFSAVPKAAAKPVAKPVAAKVEPQPDAGDLIAKAHDAEARGESDLALRLAQSAIVADPARPASYVALGDVYAALSQPDFARSYYSEALAIDPADADALKAMAALDRGGDQRAASAAGTKTGNP